MMTNPVKKEGKKVIMDGIMDYLAKLRQITRVQKEQEKSLHNTGNSLRGTQLPK